MSTLAFILVEVILYLSGWLAGYIYHRATTQKPPILYVTDGTYVEVIYGDGTVELLSLRKPEASDVRKGDAVQPKTKPSRKLGKS